VLNSPQLAGFSLACLLLNKPYLLRNASIMLAHTPPAWPAAQAASSLLSVQTSADFEQQAALLSGWNQGYAQLSAGGFAGYVAELRFDDLHLFLEYSSQSLFQQGQLDTETVAVGVPLSFSGNGLFCGSACNRQSMHIFSGKNGFEFFSPPQLLMAGIAVRRDALLDKLNDEDSATAIAHIAHAKLLNMDSAKTQTLRELMAGAFAMIANDPQLLQSRQNQASLRQSVLSLLTECLVDHIDTGDQTTQQLALTHAKCRDIIAATRDLVLHNVDRPLTVAEVCQQLGVSRRSLQYCFQNLLNTTPMAYLRAQRLNGVRTMLKTAHSVTEAAAHWGFWHFGHFSQEYKKMFGELPSVTFKKLHSH
jgi:AraC family ethanolamine operon transcriptional activator